MISIDAGLVLGEIFEERNMCEKGLGCTEMNWVGDLDCRLYGKAWWPIHFTQMALI